MASSLVTGETFGRTRGGILSSSNKAGRLVPLLQTSAKGVKQLIGGLHLRKVGGDVVVSAPKIVLGGGVGQFNGGGSSLKLSGGPVKLTGSVIAIDAAAVVKLASDLKIG